MATQELIREIAIGLSELDRPDDDPLVEVELVGVAPTTPFVTISGTGLHSAVTGPLFLLSWKEAERLAVAVEAAQRFLLGAKS